MSNAGMYSAIGNSVMSIGFTATQNAYATKAANQKSKALAHEAAIKANQRADETTTLAASQKVSFLNSGIEVSGEQGTTPASLLSDTYTKGKGDINQIQENYYQMNRNLYTALRTQLIGNMSNMYSTLSSNASQMGSSYASGLAKTS